MGLGFPSAPVGVTTTTAVLVASGEPGFVWTAVVKGGGALTVEVLGMVQLPLEVPGKEEGEGVDMEDAMLLLRLDVMLAVPLLKTRVLMVSGMGAPAAAAPATVKARATNGLFW